jgi:hypothetical protein
MALMDVSTQDACDGDVTKQNGGACQKMRKTIAYLALSQSVGALIR